jgi:type 1 fimbriae regulatory protein FimB/type 1 fimbriae regulatory protein FimE
MRIRTRKYLTTAEVEKLMAEAKGRWGHRDATMILIAYRHGLRASEIADLEWSQVEFGRAATLHVRRAKNGKPSAHPIRGDEVRALRKLRRQFPDSAFVFSTERGGPFTPDAINRLIKRIGARWPRLSGARAHAAPRLRLRWPMPATTRGASKIGSATDRSSTRCATRN